MSSGSMVSLVNSPALNCERQMFVGNEPQEIGLILVYGHMGDDDDNNMTMYKSSSIIYLLSLYFPDFCTK